MLKACESPDDPGCRVQRRCRLPRRSRAKRISPFQTRPGSALLKCRHGSMRTGNRSLQRAARRQRPVNAPPRRRGRKREQKHRGRGNLQAPQKGWHNPATPERVRRQARHCEFLTETRRLRSSSVPDTRQAAGMRLPASILWHSASVSGCDLGPHSMIYPTDGVAGRLAAYLCAGWLPRLLAPKTRHGRHSRLHGATASCRSNFVLLNRPRISTVP